MAFTPEKIIIKETFGGKEFDVIYQKGKNPIDDKSYREMVATDPEKAENYCSASFNPSTYIVPNEEDILCERDVPVKMRDGVTLYCDIYRPVGQTNIPVLLSWSFFGKRPADGLDDFQIMGVGPGTVSNMAKFESPDPGYWCRKGYAVANVDNRGVEYSEGNVQMFGSQDGRDGYDFVEWISQQWWCNGKVGLGGNSGVAMPHCFIAAEQPPHLAAIAPWEATQDLYRESATEGGVRAPGFNRGIQDRMPSNGYCQDMTGMSYKYPYMNEYWEDKIPNFKNVVVPTYLTACWQHFHLRGSMNMFRKIKSTKKWLRAHREFEWPDDYVPAHLAELNLYFDRYLKNIRNGWEMTPRVRIEVMDSYDFDYVSNRPEKEFPLKRTQYKRLYLDAADMSMAYETPVEKEAKVSYDSALGEACFDYQFTEDTELTGYMYLKLWVEAEGHNDADLFVTVMKMDAEGNWLPTSVLDEPHPGIWGKLKVSQRALDKKLSTAFNPVQSHREEDVQMLEPGVPVESIVELYPTSRFWHKGEKIRVRVCGRYIREGWFETLAWETCNKEGINHVLHTGGKYESYLQIPVIPPKFIAGDYIYR